ncbi:MAG: PD-(D/E)XK nuclease family protein, partial [Dehalococcoidaceae bacterium]|nr:PD-(D/E)XK nuclease family protein [Dehalococcoidaceae bacterium]
IYRFRRADIAAVQEVSGMLGGEPVLLEQNFRSQEPVIGWVNSVFAEWMGEGKPGIQACYVNLSSRWNDAAGEPGMGVYRFGSQVEGKAHRVKTAEAASVARIISAVKNRNWRIRQKGNGSLCPAKYSDICILLPRRTNLPYIERALDGAEIPYRVESESFVLGSQDVRELLNCLKAIDSPADRVALVAALRSSAFAISDVELVEFVDAGGNLDYTSPGAASTRVGEALEVLADYNRRRVFEPVDRLIESFIRERRMAELAFGRTRPRERLRRLKLVTEQARAFGSIGERSLRVFIDWMTRQMDEQARMVEIPVPETDEDAVRIMTMHAAKGLEFPVVILAGLGSGKNFAHPVIFGEDGACQVKLGSKEKAFCTAGHEAAEELEKEAEQAEKIRLMYVAATRARDYLLVSLYRSDKGSSDAVNEIIEDIAGRTGCGWRDLDPENLETPPVKEAPGELAGRAGTAEDRQDWIERNRKVIRAASVPPAVAVTTVARQPEEQEAEAGEVYYRKGRGGTSLGRAVHSVLQTIDLATGKDIEQLSRSQADVEGIPEREAEVARLVKKALAMPAVRRAVASGRYWREFFIGLPHDNRQVEGFIDLLFEEEGGLVIADYKTDVVLDFEDPAKLARYRVQAGLYALAVQELTGKPVIEVSLLFLSAGREMNLGDIEALTAEARQQLGAVLETGGGR